MKSDENGYWYGKSGQRPLLHKSGDRAQKTWRHGDPNGIEVA